MIDNYKMNWEGAVMWLRDQKDQQELVKACFYDDPLVDAAKRYWKCSEWKAVRKFLPECPGKALDIGAGRGISSYALAMDGWKVVALEPDPSNLVGAGAIRSLVKQTKIDVKVSERWGEKIPFKNEMFDLVFAREALHHAKNLRSLCKEASRVLKKGGTFIAIREHVISRKEDLPLFLNTHPLHKLYGGENAYLLDEYEKSIEGAGIKLTGVLNPLESDINLFPRKNRFMPKVIVKILGNIMDYPGRIYSFIGIKK